MIVFMTCLVYYGGPLFLTHKSTSVQVAVAGEGDPVVRDEIRRLQSAISLLETQISKLQSKIEESEKMTDAEQSELKNRVKNGESVEIEYTLLTEDKKALTEDKKALAAKEQQLAAMRRKENILLEREKPTPDAGMLYPCLNPQAILQIPLLNLGSV